MHSDSTGPKMYHQQIGPMVTQFLTTADLSYGQKCKYFTDHTCIILTCSSGVLYKAYCRFSVDKLHLQISKDLQTHTDILVSFEVALGMRPLQFNTGMWDSCQPDCGALSTYLCLVAVRSYITVVLYCIRNNNMCVCTDVHRTRLTYYLLTTND